MTEFLFDDQTPFAGIEFAENPEPRCACVLLLDTSSSMGGEKIKQLNLGLQAFKDELLSDTLSAKRVELSIITFGPVNVVDDFRTIDQFEPPQLQAAGATPTGAAIKKAIELVHARKEEYKRNGISYYRPWIFLITDGEPTDSWQAAIPLIQQTEEAKAAMFFAVGVDNANMDVLQQLSVRTPLKLKGLEFTKLFEWLSNSLSSVSHSSVGDQIALQDPTGPNGWGLIEG